MIVEFTNDILNKVIETFNSKENKDKLSESILDPLIQEINNRLYPYIILIFLMYILILILIITILILLIMNKNN